MIDKTTGILTINPDLLLDPSGATGLLYQETPLPETEAWRTLERQPIRDAAGRKMALRVHLHHEKLEQAALFYYLPGEPDFGSWDDWSYEAEMRRKDLHDGILLEELGEGPYSYPWGELRSVYDDKGGFSLIAIRYNQP